VYKTVRRWKDRRKCLDLPLFPGYVFVRVALADQMRVLQIPGVVRLVGFNGRPLPLPDNEIDGLKIGLAAGVLAEPHPFLIAGRRVQIKGGPLAGREGILLRRKGRLRVVLSIELIMRSVVVDMDVENVVPIARTSREIFSHACYA
jgi:transcription antitermination factor NusG